MLTAVTGSRWSSARITSSPFASLYFSTAILAAVFGAVFTAVFGAIFVPASSFRFELSQKAGVAVIEEQPGKWGPVEFIVALDPVSGKVKNLGVLAYSEKRGRPIARRNFLDQFVGKGGSDLIQVHKDIRAVSGATISSEASCFAVKKVIALYELLYLKQKS